MATKIFFLLGLVALFCVQGSLATGTQVQATMMSESANNAKFHEQLDSSRFGRLFKTFLEMKVKGDVDYNPLFAALDNMEKSFKQKIKEEASDFGAYSLNYQKYKDEVKRVVNELTALVAESKQKLENQLSRDKKQVEEYIETGNRNLAQNAEQKSRQIELRERDKKRYLSNTNLINSAVESIDQALELLSSLRSGSQSLVQIKADTVKDLMNEIKGKTFLITEFEYAPLVSAMIDIALRQDFIDREAANEIVSLLNQVRSNLVRSLANAEAGENQALEAFTKMVASIDESTRQLEKKKSDDTNQLMKIQAEMKFKKKLIEVSLKVQKRYNNALEDLEKQLEERKKQNAELIQQLENDISLIKQLIAVLNEHGIRKTFGN